MSKHQIHKEHSSKYSKIWEIPAKDLPNRAEELWPHGGRKDSGSRSKDEQCHGRDSKPAEKKQ
jgi:hypothetical protein